MQRRRFLALAGSLSAAAAGCLGASGDEDEGVSTPAGGQPSTPSETPSATGDDADRTTPVAQNVDGVDLPVPRSELRQPLPRDYIPAIVDPAFGSDWDDLDAGGRDTTLPDDAPVLGVRRDDKARAYPLRILDHHEVVNDDFGGPIAVTYCVLCGSGVVVERRVAGEPTTFGVSGKLWRSDLVMYDSLTGSLWSQLMATAIRGPRTGERLTLLPSSLTTWGEWRAGNPDTEVLLPPPHSGAIDEYDRSFDYFAPKYGYAGERQLVGRDSHDGDLHPKTLVIGVSAGDTSRAYPFPTVSEAGVVNDRVGDRPVVVATAPDGTLVAYDRRVDGESLQFTARGDRFLAAGGSRWNRISGTAVDGPYEGRRLRRASDHPPMFWTGWSEFNPDTDVYGMELNSPIDET